MHEHAKGCCRRASHWLSNITLVVEFFRLPLLPCDIRPFFGPFVKGEVLVDSDQAEALTSKGLEISHYLLLGTEVMYGMILKQVIVESNMIDHAGSPHASMFLS